MSSDSKLDDALRALARQGRQERIPTAADIRRRGDSRRRRRRGASVALVAVAVAALGTGVALTRVDGTPDTASIGPAGPNPGPVNPSLEPVDPPPAAAHPSPEEPAVPPGSSSGDSVLSGRRQVAIVRVDAYEGALSLLADGRLGEGGDRLGEVDGRLDEVDGDGEIRLFVFAPQGPNTYQIRAAERGTDLSDTCWQVRSSGSQPLRVEAAPCAPDERRQQFTVVQHGQHDGAPTYAISSHSAYLQKSRTRGLILEELGDAPLTTRFLLIDNGSVPN